MWLSLRIYRVLTENNLISSYCHTKIFRILVEPVVIMCMEIYKVLIQRDIISSYCHK
jgi:hypothetical protein